MLLVLFGLSASGKNFVANTLAEQWQFHYWDADEFLSSEMKESIKQKITFTQAMRDAFTKNIILKINELIKTYPNLIVTQAFYKEKNRRMIQESFPQAKFILIQAKPENILARLRKRNDWVDEAYAKKMQLNFEEPLLSHQIIINDAGPEEILAQAKLII